MARSRVAARGEGTERPHEGFTLGLALVDAVPVLEFCASMLVVAVRLKSFLFVVGALCCVLAGCGKVAWKLVLAVRGRDVPWLSANFMRRMMIGFALMVAGVVLQAGSIDLAALLARVVALPAAAFFVVALVCMVALGAMRGKLDQRQAHANWVEQLTNIALQTALLAGILVC